MTTKILLPVLAFSLLAFASCKDADNAESTTEETSAAAPAQDMTAVKAEIVALETAWADALNKKDINALMAMYADDAVSMGPNEPMVSGKASIQQAQEKEWATSKDSSTISFETLDLYGDANVVTEVGTSVSKDAAGNKVGSGKYVAIFENKDGKWLCIREIYNGDAKEK